MNMWIQSKTTERKLSTPSSALATDLAAAFFAGHPVCVESVAWSSCQPVLLATLLAAAAVHMHFQPSAWPWFCKWVPAWLILLSACLSKATAVTAPIYVYILGVEAVAAQQSGTRARLRNYLRAIWHDPTLFCVTLLGGGNLYPSVLRSVRKPLPLSPLTSLSLLVHGRTLQLASRSGNLGFSRRP